MKSVFLDASYLIALEIVNDQSHNTAKGHWERTESCGLPSLITTTYVFSEVITYLNSRGLHSKGGSR